MVENVPSILENGLIPGGPGGSTHGGGRNSIHMALWPISDKRCQGGMRKSGSVDALIYLNKVSVVQSKKVSGTPGLCALVNQTIEPGLIHCITYFLKGIKGPEIMLWHADLKRAHV